MLSPKPSTVSTKPRSSIGADRGGHSRLSSSRRWSGWTGSTIAGCWSPSQHPASRSRGTLLCHDGATRHGGVTQTKQPPQTRGGSVSTTTTTTGDTSAVTLYAFNAVASDDGTLKQLFSPLRAGTWPSTYHSIAVPVVADGKVFVASNNRLLIFGATPLTCPPGEGWIEKGNAYQCTPIPACPASCRFGCLIDNVPPGPIRFICKIYGKIP